MDEDGDWSMRAASHSDHLPYWYLEHHRGRAVEYAIRNLAVDPYASGERDLLGGDGSQNHVKL